MHITITDNRIWLWALVALIVPSFVLVPSSLATDGSASVSAGTLAVDFNYMPPGEAYPTYDTAIWLEDKSGKLVETLFVSEVLSDVEYKSGDICPDWTTKADWGNKEGPIVDAVTRPTPLIGGESHAFDLGALGVAPGIYEFRFEVHFVDEYNVLFRGELSVDETAGAVNLERVYVPKEREGNQAVVDSIRVHYFPKVAP